MFKLGKLRPRVDKRTLAFSRYVKKLPAVPPVFGHQNIIKKDGWGMLGNDKVGCCVFSAAAHETMLWGKLGKRSLGFTEYGVVLDYAEVTGYTSSDPMTDRGTVVIDALNFRRKKGVRDIHGHRHKIGGYAALTPGNIDHVRAAMYLFENVEIGFNFPDTAMDQFNAGADWTVVDGAQVAGGHDVPCVGWSERGIACVTWGRLQWMTLDFFKKYCDEAYAILSTEMLSLTSGKSVEGFSQADLKADLAIIDKPY